MAEDALQRVAQFVGDARDELTERRELSVCEPAAQPGPGSSLVAASGRATMTLPACSRSWLSRSVTVTMNDPFSTDHLAGDRARRARDAAECRSSTG
jgi:hypothetical protein